MTTMNNWPPAAITTEARQALITDAANAIAASSPYTPVKGTLHYQQPAHPADVEGRLAVSTMGTLMRMAPRSRRRGYPVSRHDPDLKGITLRMERPADMTSWSPFLTFKPPRGKAKPKTAAAAYAEDLRKRRDYFLRNALPQLWANIRLECETLTDEALAAFAAETGPQSHYEAWCLAGDQYGLPRIERHKTITLRTCKCPQYIMDKIAADLEAERNFGYYWSTDYDYSCSAKQCDDGIYRAWLAQEYKGMGNGHYWLLISPTQAIFCEDD